MKEWSVARGLRVEACLHEVLFRDPGIAGVAEKHEHVAAVVVDITPCIGRRGAISLRSAVRLLRVPLLRPPVYVHGLCEHAVRFNGRCDRTLAG
jgi:hypothetical protein